MKQSDMGVKAHTYEKKATGSVKHNARKSSGSAKTYSTPPCKRAT